MFSQMEIPAARIQAVWTRQAWHPRSCRRCPPRWSSSCTCHWESADGTLQLFWLHPQQPLSLFEVNGGLCVDSLKATNGLGAMVFLTKDIFLYFNMLPRLFWWGNCKLHYMFFGLAKPDFTVLATKTQLCFFLQFVTVVMEVFAGSHRVAASILFQATVNRGYHFFKALDSITHIPW